MNGSQCNVCGKPGTWHDPEYDEYYCDEHAEEYDDGTLERLAGDEEGPYVTKSGRAMTEKEIEKLAQEAEQGYDVEQFRFRERPVEVEVLGLEEAMLDFELTQPLKPWTVTIEITLSARGQIHAQSLGTEVLDHALSGLDGAAGAVMRVEPNT